VEIEGSRSKTYPKQKYKTLSLLTQKGLGGVAHGVEQAEGPECKPKYWKKKKKKRHVIVPASSYQLARRKPGTFCNPNKM
jgi:hypothetical protein